MNIQEFIPPTPLAKVTDVETLQSIVRFLYDLLDWVDTADDMAKSNDSYYRKLCQGYQRKRHARITSDGYDLFIVNKHNEKANVKSDVH